MACYKIQWESTLQGLRWGMAWRNAVTCRTVLAIFLALRGYPVEVPKSDYSEMDSVL